MPFIKSLALLLLGMPICALVKADIVDDGVQQVFGRVDHIVNDVVFVNVGCDAKHQRPIQLTRVESIVFNSACGPTHHLRPSSGLLGCTDPVNVLSLRFDDLAEPVYADKISLRQNGQFSAILGGNRGALYGLAGKLRVLSKSKVCKKDLEPLDTYPVGFCFEPQHWAANWSLTPVYNNAIFTKGFSVLIQGMDSGDKPDPSAIDPNVDIRTAMGFAIGLWTAALSEHQSLLDEKVASYLTGITSRSEGGTGMTLLTYPQVVQVACPPNAQFLIEVHSGRDSAFTNRETDYAAKAQMEGRTIFLNAIDFQFVSDIKVKEFLPEHRVNLITVLTHELGHAFGLEHRDDDPDSVMRSYNPAYKPSVGDVRALAAALKRNVEGAKAGELDPTNCAGLRVRFPKE